MNVIDHALPVLHCRYKLCEHVHFIHKRNGKIMMWCEEERVDKADDDVCHNDYEIGMDGITKQFETGRRQQYNFAFDCRFTPGYQYVLSLVPVPIIEKEEEN